MLPRPRQSCPHTGDLLSWEPPQPVKAFPPERVRAASLPATFSRAIGEALRDDGRSRAEVAADMSAFLGESVTENMLDKYASEAAESHVPSIVRFLAIVHATRDARLLQILADAVGLAVIDKAYLPYIDLALGMEREREVKAFLDAARDRIKRGGAR